MTPTRKRQELIAPELRQLKRGLGWGAVLASAVISLSLLAFGAWVMSFVSRILAQDNLLGWLAFSLLCIAGVAALVIIIREVSGLMRLRALHKFRAKDDAALTSGDPAKERKCLRRLKALYHGRSDMTWALARLADHEKDIRDPGDLLVLAERDLMLPLDQQAKQQIVKSAKKVSIATAISPAAILDILFVLAENLSLLRRLATLYGARPGFVGGVKLARMVVTHIIATGGLALTDDLFGQFLGQDLVRRMSRRLGEGVFNGALTARIGIAAIEVLRPLPFIEQKPVRLRELVPLIFKKAEGAPPGSS